MFANKKFEEAKVILQVLYTSIGDASVEHGGEPSSGVCRFPAVQSKALGPEWEHSLYFAFAVANMRHVRPAPGQKATSFYEQCPRPSASRCLHADIESLVLCPTADVSNYGEHGCNFGIRIGVPMLPLGPSSASVVALEASFAPEGASNAAEGASNATEGASNAAEGASNAAGTSDAIGRGLHSPALESGSLLPRTRDSYRCRMCLHRSRGIHRC